MTCEFSIQRNVEVIKSIQSSNQVSTGGRGKQQLAYWNEIQRRAITEGNTLHKYKLIFLST